MWTATSGISREDPGFLQRRVALFGLAASALGFIFLAFRAVLAVATRQYREFTEASFLLHLLGAGSLLAIWVVCRAGARSPGFVHAPEATGLIASSLAYELMGWCLPPEARPDMIVLLALTYSLMARAAYVPSPARRTLVLSLAIGTPFVVGTYLAFRTQGEALVRLAGMDAASATAEGWRSRPCCSTFAPST